MTPPSRRWYPPVVPVVSPTAVLTPRQADVLTGIALGLSNAQIGRRLGLAEDTIKSHTRRLFAALGARDRAHAASLTVSGAVEVIVRGWGK